MCFILGQNDDSKSHWIKKASLVDSRTSVTDVKFGPRHLGLLLATCSADGTVRIYEAPDVMNLSQWSLQHEIQCNLPCRYVRRTWYIQFLPKISRNTENLFTREIAMTYGFFLILVTHTSVNETKKGQEVLLFCAYYYVYEIVSSASHSK